MGACTSIDVEEPATVVKPVTSIKKVLEIPGLLTRALGFLSIEENCVVRSCCKLFLKEVSCFFQVFLLGLFSKVNYLPELIQTVMSKNTFFKMFHYVNDEVFPENKTRICSWIELAILISGRSYQGSIRILMDVDGYSIFPILGAEFLQSIRIGTGSFELTTQLRYGVCIRSRTLDDFLSMVYCHNRQLCIHGFVVECGSNDASYLYSIGGLFDFNKRAYVFALRSGNSLCVQVLQVQSNNTYVELVCLLQATVSESPIFVPWYVARSDPILSLEWQLISHMNLLCGQYGQLLQFVHHDSLHIIISVCKSIGIDEQITCRKNAYGSMPRIKPLPPVIIDMTFGIVPEFTSHEVDADEMIVSVIVGNEVLVPFVEGHQFLPEPVQEEVLNGDQLAGLLEALP